MLPIDDKEVYIVSVARTPFGSLGGSLSEAPMDDLSALTIDASIQRAGISGEEVNGVIFGNVISASPFINIARVGLLKAGLPDSVPGMTVNRVCASGLEAINLATQSIRLGIDEIMVAGGVENLTRSPYIVEKFSSSFQRGPQVLMESFGGPRSAPVSLYGDLTMGDTAENVAVQYSISREAQDEFSIESQQRAVAAQDAGLFTEEIVPVPIPDQKGEGKFFTVDEHPRRNLTVQDLSRLNPAFRSWGTVTAGNSSGINDGAAAVVIMSGKKVKEKGVVPLGRVVHHAVAGVNPQLMGIGPVVAIRKLLKETGMTVKDIDLFEINEAFAAQSLACIQELGLPINRTNVNGGAIALGHPLGASGARLIGTLLYELRRRGERYGIVSLCIGGGQGLATLVEAVR